MRAHLSPTHITPRGDPLPSKFGPLTLASFIASKGTQRNCLAFVRAYSDPRLQLSGWFCQGCPEFIEQSTLSCALDRLTLLAAGSEPSWVPCSPRLNSIAAIVANAVQSWPPRPNIISSGRRTPKSWSPAAPHAKRRSPFEKWTLPTSCRRARRIRRLEIVQHQFTIFAFQVGHAVLCCHNRERLFPLPAIHALRGDQLEAMTCGTGIERFRAAWSRGKFLRAFIAWSELLRLSEASRQGEKCDHEKQRP